jgi:hypothetical protein
MPNKRGGRRANPGGRPPKPLDERVAFKGKIANRVSPETALLAQQLMLREWPGVGSIEQLIEYALRRLKETTMDYQIKPVQVDGFADANGVYENSHGAWLGEVDWQGDKQVVLPYNDEDGDYIPAPSNWRDLVVKAL